jgi:ABC-type multidrug transport system fused ATPase/permease subunit
MTAPKRRWFQWSLRTLFVVVTVAALLSAWVVYQLNWIRQRNSARNWIAAHRAALSSAIFEKRPFPWPLRILGEQPENLIEIVTDDMGRVEELRSLFPEATVLNHRSLTSAPKGYSRNTYGE